MRPYQGFLIDLDGTVYNGAQTIAGAKKFIELLQKRALPFLFVTNNAVRSHSEVAAFLAASHEIQVGKEQIYSSVDALLFELGKVFLTQPLNSQAYVIGSPYLKEVVAKFGFSLTTSWQAAEIVIVGLDQQVTYSNIAEAAMAVQKGAQFFLTNPDIQFPDHNGLFLPGAGVLGQAISAVAGGIKPVVCGKPSAAIIDGALNKLNVDANCAVMIGDNLKTDISAAINAGIDSILIETGVNNRQDSHELGILPTHIVKNYDELVMKCFPN